MFVHSNTALSHLTSHAKVGHVTCDNASSNKTMMREFAARLTDATGRDYDWTKHKIKYVI